MIIKILLIIGCWVLAHSHILHADDNIWTTNGPEGGRVMTIAIHPDDSRRMLLGTVEAGIYKTIDGGGHWTRILSDVLDNTLREITYFPGAPDTVFAATLNGLYRSQDGGETWTLVEFPIGPYNEIMDVEIHPVYHNLIFAAGSWTQWRSSDGGANWDTLRIPFVAVMAVRTDPLRPDTMYLITHSRRMRWTVFRSVNLGLDWETIHNDLDTNLFAMDLRIDPVNSDIIYVVGVNWRNVSRVCICKTTDGGNHWFNITPDGLHAPNVNSLTISPFDHNTLYACTEKDGVLKSEDGGLNWTLINEGLTGRVTYQVVIDPITAYLYLATIDDGIFKSTDEGAHWHKISGGIFNALCLDIAIHPRNPDTVYVAAENGHFRSTDGGQTWEEIGLPLPFQPARTRSVEIDATDPDFVVMSAYHFAPYDSSAVFRSLDGGDSWECLLNSIPALYDIAISNTGLSRRLFCGSLGIYYSDDDGNAWQPCAGPLPIDEFYGFVRVSPADPLMIFAISDGQRLWRSSDRGTTWGEGARPPGGIEIVSFTVDPTSSSVLYAGIYQGGLFKSTDSGDSWVDITNDLPICPTYINISGMAVNPANPQNLLAYSHGYGMHMSDNGGLSWRPFNEGLPLYCAAGYAAISPVDTSRIYFATMQGSTWSIHRTLTGVGDDETELPGAFSLSAYPNPFNSTTTITVEGADETKIQILDISGRRVTVLHTGGGKAVWDAGAFSSGVYFARAETSGIARTILLTLLK